MSIIYYLSENYTQDLTQDLIRDLTQDLIRDLTQDLMRDLTQDLTTELCVRPYARPYNGIMCEGSRRGIIIHYS